MRFRFAAILVPLAFVACDSRGPCERQFTTASEVRACQDGADQIAPGIYKSIGMAATPEQAETRCKAGCDRRYNIDQVPVGNQPGFLQEIADLADLVAACRSACKVKIGYLREMAERQQAYERAMDSGCMDIHGQGGITRCY
jgi:hypothetical protein